MNSSSFMLSPVLRALWHHAALEKCLPTLGYASVPLASERLYLSLLGWWAMILSGVFTQLTPASPGSLYAFPYAQGSGAVSLDTKEMKQALTLVCRPVSRDPLTPASRVLAWSVSLSLIISTPHMCLCGVWEHYRLQSAMASDQWPTIAPPPHPPIPRAWHYSPFPSPFPSCSSHPAMIIERRGYWK